MRPPQHLRKLLLVSLVCTNILVALLCVFSLQQSREQYELRAESLTQTIASALDQDLSGSVDKIDQALLTVADELERQLAAGKLDPDKLVVFLKRHEERLPEVEAFRVANADGLVILGKGVSKDTPVSWADRDYFSYHRTYQDGTLYIAEPRMGRVARQYIIGFSRRYNYPDGSFAGVISAPIALSHFTRILSRFDLGAHGSLILRAADLALISRVPSLAGQAAGQIGSRKVSPELAALIASGQTSATYRTANGPDGEERLLTFRRLAKAPMFVLAGTAHRDYLADWFAELRQTAAMAAAFLLLTIVTGLFMLRLLAKIERRESMLNRSIEHGQRQRDSLRRLNEIAALSHLPLAEQLQQALVVGSRLLDLEFGIVSRVRDDIYRIVAQVSPNAALHNDQEFPFGQTYCSITLQTTGVVAISHMGASPHAGHPCYQAFKLESYIAAPIHCDGEVFGTVNFSSPKPYHRDFDETDSEFMALLARWVGSAIERDRAQQKLASSERHLQTIIETEPECVKVLSADGRLLQMNRAGLGMIEADSLEQVIGRDLMDIVAEPDRAAFNALNERVMRGETGSLEFEIVGLKGSHRHLETHAVPMHDNAGRITSILAVTRDITARKRDEAELAQHRQHLEELVEQRTAALLETEARASHIIQSSADGLYGVDARGVITFINPAACEILGYTAEQVIGRTGHALFHHSKPDGSPYPIEECPSHSALQLGRKARADNEVYWHADGHAIPVMYAIHPMQTAGKTVGAVISFVDISEQRAAAFAREQALFAAENLARIRSEFLANMSHEIRTPLNGVLGFADIGFRNCENSAKARDAFAKIQLSGKRLLGVINDVLDFSKIEAGKLGIEQTTVHLAEVVDHAVELLSDRAAAKGIELRVELAGDLPATCLSDPLRLGQILLNVLSNAIKFTERGHVALTVSLQGDELAFRVVDTGIGMNDAHLAELFNPFQQADASSTRKFGGTGLGLAISKRILDLMQGRIEIQSQPGIGTRVDIRLPYVAAPARSQEKTPAPTPGEIRPLAGISFLVAEDEPINQSILYENLVEDGARVVMVGNGREAVERVRADGGAAYDFVLMDIQMPEMDGYEACRRIRAIAPELPIIAQTAHAFSEEREKCLAAGMIGHLAKPVDLENLLEIIRRHKRSARAPKAAACLDA